MRSSSKRDLEDAERDRKLQRRLHRRENTIGKILLLTVALLFLAVCAAYIGRALGQGLYTPGG